MTHGAIGGMMGRRTERDGEAQVVRCARRLGLHSLWVWMLVFLASPSARGATHYRSIGTNAGVLYAVGTASVTAGGTTVTFGGGASLPLPTATGAVGPGDLLTLELGQANEEVLFILSRDSDQSVTLQSPALFGHASASFAITRAFGGATALQTWEDSREGNLVAENRVEVGVVYNDGPFSNGVDFQGSTTDASRFMRLTVAEGQRHHGTASTGARIDGNNSASGEVIVRDDFVRLEWLVVTRVKGALAACVRVVAANDTQIQNVLVHDCQAGIRETGATANLTVRNSVASGSLGGGIEASGATSTGRVENCTLYGNAGPGVDTGNAPFEIENTISIGNAGLDFSGSAFVPSHNVSSDGSATGVGSVTGAVAVDQFVNISVAPFDLHLKAGASAIDAGLDLSSRFTFDFDDQTRGAAAWDVGADEIIVPQPSLASAASQTFLVGASSTTAETLTITDDDATPTIAAANDLRLRLPPAFPMIWDPAVTTVSLGGSAASKVDATIAAYEDGSKTVVLDVTANFVAGDALVVDGLRFMSFAAPAASDRIALEVGNDGLVSALDAETIRIVAVASPVVVSAADQIFTVGDPPTLASEVTVIDGSTPSINSVDEIRIRIPEGLVLTWDTSVTSIGTSGPAAPKVATSVTYEDFGLTAVLNVTTDFAGSESVTVSGLSLKGFIAPVPPDRLELEVGDDGLVVDVDDRTKSVVAGGGVQALTATARDGEVKLQWVNPPSGPYVSTRLLRRTGTPPTSPTDPLATIVADQSGPLGGADEAPDDTVSNGITYHYAAWVDEGGSFSSPRRVTARPFATSGPVKWAYSTGATAMTPPSIRFQGGLAFVYAVSNDGFFHAMKGGPNGGDWPPGWKPSRIGSPVQARPPLVPFPVGGAGNGAAFVGAQNGRVYAIDAVSGAFVWTTPRGESIQAAVGGMFAYFGGSANRLLVGTRNSSLANEFLGLDVDDGSLAWSFVNGSSQGGNDQAIGLISGGAVIDYSANRVCFASQERSGGSNTTLWCLSFTDSSVSLDKSWALGDIEGSPTLFNGRLYVGNTAGEVFALDPITGAQEWTFPLADGRIKGYPFPQFGAGSILVSTDGKLTSLLDEGGAASINWQEISIPSPSTPIQVPFQPWAYLGSSDGHLYQLNGTTGGGLTSVVLGDGGSGVGSPTFDLLNGMIYVGTEDGVFYGVVTPVP